MRYEEFRLGGVALQIIMALLLDAIFGDPRGIPHPVAGIGRLISFYEKFFYGRGGSKAGGAMLCAAVLVTAGAAAFFVYNAVAQFVRWEGLQIGYESDDKSCFGLTRFDWNRTIYNAKRIGIFFAVGLILFGVYRFFEVVRVDIHFIARAVLVLFFVMISFVTRRLRIPNVYLYIAAVIIFNIVCLI